MFNQEYIDNMAYENEVYEDELAQDGARPTGLKSKKPDKAAFLNSARSTWGANMKSPFTQTLEDVVGQSDYGNSMYDEQGFSIPQVRNLENTRSELQPLIHKLGAGIGTFAGNQKRTSVRFFFSKNVPIRIVVNRRFWMQFALLGLQEF